MRFERIRRPQVGQIAAVEQLQELDHELDIANAAAAGLHVVRPAAAGNGPLLDPPLQGLDAADVGVAQIAAVDPGRQRLQKLLAQGKVAGHGPSLDVRLPLPGAAAIVVVAQGRLHAHHDRPPRPFRPQAEIHPINAPQVGLLRQQANQLAGDQVEEFEIRQRTLAVGLSFAFTQEHQVDIAGIVQFQPAELAQPEHNKAGRPAIGTARRAALPLHFRQAARRAASTIASARYEICVVTVFRLCSRTMSP